MRRLPDNPSLLATLLKRGTQLGSYEIKEPLGKGGMGEVFRAEDERLAHKVAIKVLPEEYSADPERLARFEQEARPALMPLGTRAASVASSSRR